ncbi:Putative uncharacterized protein FLJ37770 [Eumeta japonica]|uniref:Mos1 transposase HTH domain-containing protein n=1 Tax=Eumeta variegata TaxID=151549 RepID=A0A4C1WWF4_EUMVA|nr:Putative uncharacterized protein FLJ37770 [Eumeta japonica]
MVYVPRKFGLCAGPSCFVVVYTTLIPNSLSAETGDLPPCSIESAALDRARTFHLIAPARFAGHAPQQSLALLRTAFGDEGPCKTTIYNWFAEFKHGRVNLSDELRNGRPSSAVNNKNIDTVRDMIEIDRHVTHHEIRASLGIGMSQLQSILHKQNQLCGQRFSSPEEAVQEYEKHVSKVTREEGHKFQRICASSPLSFPAIQVFTQFLTISSSVCSRCRRRVTLLRVIHSDLLGIGSHDGSRHGSEPLMTAVCGEHPGS